MRWVTRADVPKAVGVLNVTEDMLNGILAERTVLGICDKDVTSVLVYRFECKGYNILFMGGSDWGSLVDRLKDKVSRNGKVYVRAEVADTELPLHLELKKLGFVAEVNRKNKSIYKFKWEK